MISSDGCKIFDRILRLNREGTFGNLLKLTRDRTHTTELDKILVSAFFSPDEIHFLFFLLRQDPRISLFICLLLLLVIDRPPPVLLLDQQHDGQDGEAAEGKHVAEPLDTDVGDCENAQKDHTDYVVPDKSIKKSSSNRAKNVLTRC